MLNVPMGTAKPAQWVMSYTQISNVYDVTLLALLSLRHMARCSIIAWWGKSIFIWFFDKYNHVLNKTNDSVFNNYFCIYYENIYHQYSSPLRLTWWKFAHAGSEIQRESILAKILVNEVTRKDSHKILLVCPQSEWRRIQRFWQIILQEWKWSHAALHRFLTLVRYSWG